jgi:ABC-type nitrate/sulfonate/bicarbonate transport system permease component
MRNRRSSIRIIASGAALITLWQAGSSYGVLPPLYLPNPISIVTSYRTQLGWGLLLTTTRALLGYTAGLLIAYVAHFLCLSTGLDRHLDAQFTGARAVPVIAVLPLFLIWFGFREIGRVVVVTLATTAFFIAPLHEAYGLLPRQWTMLRKQVPLTLCRFYVSVVVPGTLPALAAALRVSLAIAFTMSIASEYVGAQLGIGKFLDSARITFNVPAIFLGIFLCSAIGIGLDRMLMHLYRSWVSWAGKQSKL